MELNIDSFLTENPLFSGLKARIINFTTPEEKMLEVRRWFEESTTNNLSLFELYFIKSQHILLENYSAELIELWADRNKNLDDIEEVKSFSSNVQDDLFKKKLFNAIFKNFSQQTDFNFLLYAISTFSGSFYKKDIIDCWCQYNSFNFQGLLTLINNLEDFNSLVLANQWIRNNKDISINNLCEVISSFDNFFDRGKVIANFIKETKHNFSSQDVSLISSFLDQYSCCKMIKNIIYAGDTTNLSEKIQFIAKIIDSGDNRNSLIKNFLINFKEDITELTLIELLRLVKNDKDIYELIDVWAKRTGGELSTNCLLDIVNLSDNQLFGQRMFFNWSRRRLFQIPLDDFSKIISHIEMNQNTDPILVNWILHNAEKINAEQLIKIASLITKYESQVNSFKDWFCSSAYSPNLSDLVEVLKHDSTLAEDLIPIFFGLFKDDEVCKLEQLVKLIKEFQYIDIYNISELVDLFLDTALDKTFLLDLIFSIYPNNELMWSEVVKFFIDNGHIEDYEYENVVIPVLQRINDSELALELIESINEYFELNEIDLLNLVKGRFRANNESVVNILKNIKINGDDNNLGIFNVGALDELKLIFGDRIKNDLIEEIVGLVDILSYYETKKLLPNFVAMLNDNVRLQVKSKTELSNRKPFLLEEELKTLQILTDNKFNPTKTKAICEYFREIIVLKDIDQRFLFNNYQIKFGESANFISQEKQNLVNNLFKNMIFSATREESVAELEQNVKDFFSNAMSGGGEEVKLSKANLETITKFVKYYHQEIYNLFMQEAGFSKLISEVHALNDGCIHNLGNKINIIINNALIDDKIDSMFYQTMVEKVVIPLINSKNDSILNEKSFLTNKDVISSFIIPEAFLQESLKMFYDPDNKSAPINRDAWAFIAENCGSEKRDEIMGEIDDLEKVNQLGAEVATIIFLDKLLENVNNSSLYNADKSDLINLIGDMQQGLFKSNEVFLSRIGAILSTGEVAVSSTSSPQRLQSASRMQLP